MVIDRFIKMVRYIPINIIINAAELADIFHNEIIYRYGIPTGVIYNRGSVFTSAF